MNNQPERDEHGHTIEHGQIDPVAQRRVSIGTLNLFAEPLRRRYEEHYHSRHRFGRAHLLLDSILVTIVVGLGLYNIYVYGFAPSGTDELPLKLTTQLEPASPSTGGATAIYIHYEYAGRLTASNGRVQVKLPNTFEIKRSIPTEGFNGYDVAWNLGDLHPKATGDLTLEGTYWGIIGHPDILVVTATGQLPSSNDTVPQEKTSSLTTLLQARRAAIESTLNVPSTIVLNQPTLLSITLTNTSTESVNGLVLKGTTPSTWTTTKTTPSAHDTVWEIGSLSPNAKRTFTIEGNYSRLPTSPSFFFRLERTAGTATQELSITRADTTILDPAVELTARIDGTSQEALNPGDSVTATISYRNRGEFPLENMTLAVEPTGEYVDPTTIEATGGTTANGVAQWSPDNQPALAQLVPDQGGEVTLRFKLLQSISLVDRSPLQDFLIRVVPRATFTIPVLPTQAVHWFGTAASLPINSKLTVLAQSRYWTPEGEQIGRGAVPPRVGSTTTYWVTVNVSNTIHDLYKTSVHIPLAPGVRWTGQSSVSAGSPLQFDEETKSLIWTIGRLDHFLGARVNAVSAKIQLTITPTESDKGTTVVLTKAFSASGTDAITKTALKAQSPETTTELSKDQKGGGKGVVQ